MSRLLLTLLLLSACKPDGATSSPGSPGTSGLAVGTAAPALSAKRLGGGDFDLAAERGKLVLVDFWASWCEPCRRELPVLQELHQQHAAAGLVVVGVSLDEQQADAEAFLREEIELDFAVVHDGDRKIGDVWSPPKMPTVFLVERDGTVARVFAGDKPGQLDELRPEVARRLAEPARK